MIRVLVVDDSVAVRGLVSALLADDPGIEVSGVAANGNLALTKYTQLRPDVVTLDVEMPEMDGLATLKALRRADPAAVVIMFSSLTHRGAVTTFDALAAGAVDYVAKPEGLNATELIRRLGADLIAKVKLHAGRKRTSGVRPSTIPAPVHRPSLTAPAASARALRRPDIVAIACSTGGPNALSAIIPSLPKDLRVPIVIVQHMPELFTRLLADRLDASSAITVREGTMGGALEPGVVYIAPGGLHMETVRAAGHMTLRLQEGPPENSCRPAADVLFRSVAAHFGGHALAVVLTGMGQDGLRGCEAIQQAGGQIVVQDEATSVVWGMPRAVAEAGLAHSIVPLESISEEIIKRVTLPHA